MAARCTRGIISFACEPGAADRPGHTQGDAAVILEVLRSAVVKLRELPYFECKMSLITLFMDIRRLIQEHSSQPLPSSWGLTSIEKQIIRQETMDNVMPWMEALITRTLEDIAAARSQSKNIALIGQVDQFIESHLTDPNLSATMLADHLGLSVNYFRSLYKAETTQSITDKISEKRLTFICQGSLPPTRRSSPSCSISASRP